MVLQQTQGACIFSVYESLFPLDIHTPGEIEDHTEANF